MDEASEGRDVMASRDHPLRYALTNELHARPFTELVAPEQVSHFGMLSPESEIAAERVHLLALCQRYGIAELPAGATHFAADFGVFRLKWERHSEFSTYTFFHRGAVAEPFAETASARVPRDWLDGLPGARLVAAHVELAPEGAPALSPDQLSRHFVPESLCRGRMLGGVADVWTDFRIHADGFARTLVQDRGMAPRQAGRLVQRLLETHTYRNMALLALPLARETGPVITRVDRSLAQLTARMKTLETTGDQQNLLDELISVSAEIEESIAATSYRFSAARAYNALVGERVAEMGEEAVEGQPRLSEFIERRLAPAMRTCESVAERQQALSERATRTADLLRTRVDIALEGQNRDLLASMDRRARLQLRLQQTVEGLSVAAITYYLVSLVGYALKAVEKAGTEVDVDLWRGVAIPVVAVAVWAGLRLVRRSLSRDGD
ncbi:MAG: DUF3422 domain-containing protein [Alphaproteobacteria bacterium]